MTFGIYIHIPFCEKACPYCAHYKEVRTDTETFQRFVRAVIQEARKEAPRWPGRPITLFLGGGTPSLLPDALLAELIQGVGRVFSLDRVREFTVEMNPEHVTPSRLAFYRDLGVNRISVGVQSFQPSLLRFLGRTHTPEILERALHTLSRGPFRRWSADLIFGMAPQHPEAFEEDLSRILSFHPPHLSVYELSVEPGTPFFFRARQGVPVTAPPARRIAFYLLRERILRARGYRRYEISNYALPGQESRHNLLYWRRQNVLGLGPGASSLRGRTRWTNRHRLDAYLAHLEGGDLPPRSVEHLTPEDVLLERVFLGLRLDEGLALPRHVLGEALQAYPEFLEERRGRLRLRFPEGVLHQETLAVEIARMWEALAPVSIPSRNQGGS